MAEEQHNGAFDNRGEPHVSESDIQISLEQFEATRKRIAPYVNRTPLTPLRSPVLEASLPAGTQVALKLELFQPTGTFKVRGAVNEAVDRGAPQVAQGISRAAVQEFQSGPRKEGHAVAGIPRGGRGTQR